MLETFMLHIQCPDFEALYYHEILNPLQGPPTL